MTRLFRSKSCTTARPTTNSFFFHASPPSPSLYLTNDDEEDDFEYDEDSLFDDGYFGNNRIRTPFISLDQRRQTQSAGNNNNFPLLTILVTALRKSIVTCSVDIDEDVASTTTSSMDIGCPTDVKHVSHVTFDRFNGFLGLPVELEPEVPRKVPSASVRVFGVSAESMQCTYDQRGNSVPTILLMMQKRLYSGGGLQAEGIFRINAENSQEEYVRNQLNEGFVPHGIDVHCLAGLIKAWFRELPTGVLDSLTPEQVMHCNSEDECTRLVKSLPPTEAALLDWAINLMADVVKHENENKMNARNIAMVFAPNMTQMADPLTALIHAVQVMNLLKTLIIKTLRERQDSFPATVQAATPNSDSPSETSYSIRSNKVDSSGQSQTMENNILRSSTLCRLESESEEKFWSFQSRNIDVMEGEECVSGRCSPVSCKRGDLCVKNGLNDENGEVEGILDRLSLRKGVKKLCRHPVFQLSKTAKKGGGGGGGFINTRGGGGEAWT